MTVKRVKGQSNNSLKKILMELNQSKKDMDRLTSVKFYNFFFNKYVQLIAGKKSQIMSTDSLYTI